MKRGGRPARWGLMACAVIALTALSSCARPADTPGSPGDSASPTPSVSSVSSTGEPWRSGVFPTTRVEPPTDADRPDGPTPTPDGELTPADLTGLIRLEASAPTGTDGCGPQDIVLSLTGFDAAAGHRYARLIATNGSDRPCSLIGWPGLGFRGEWGTAFPVVAERNAAPAERIGVPAASPDFAVVLNPVTGPPPSSSGQGPGPGPETRRCR